MIPRGKSEWLGQKLLYHSVTIYYHNTKRRTNLQRLIGTTEKNHQTTETSSVHHISAKSVNKTLNSLKQHLTQVLSLATDYYFVYSGSKLNCRNCLWTLKKRRALLKNSHVLNSTIPREGVRGAAIHRLLN